MKLKIFLSSIAMCVLLIIVYTACSDSNIKDSPPADQNSTLLTPQSTEPAVSQPSSSTGETGLVKVIYFHRSQRCHSCTYAEDQTRYTLETFFGDELASGVLTFTTYNLQDEANAQLVDEYDAHSSSLFITEIKDGTKNTRGITDIWTKIDRDEAFIKLIRAEIEESLGKI